MRTIRFFLFLAVGSSCSSNETAPGDGGTTLSCSTAVSDYCAQTHCDQSLDAALQDKALCPAFQGTCGELQAVALMGTDTSHRFYYRNGTLIGVDTNGPLGHRCVAGPAELTVPACEFATQHLAVCSQ